MKAIMAKDAFLRFPDHNKPFDIYADASDTQLGTTIFQDGAPVAFFSRKLNSTQRNYTTGEKEILSVVETLKEFHTLLYGCNTINVHTDHKNNIFTKQSNQRVLRWRLFLEDYGINFQYIKGCHNHLADALSCLPFNERQKDTTAIRQLGHPNTQYSDPLDDPTFESFFSLALDDDNLLDCFVNLPSSEGLPFVLDYATIADAQTRDALLQQKAQEQPQHYVPQLLAPATTVTCYIPAELLADATRWYHLALGHTGSQQHLLDTIQMHFYAPGLQQQVENITRQCNACQRHKNVGRPYGELAAREAALTPWSDLSINTIGPWTLQVSNQQVEFKALTIIDTVTNLVELVRLDNGSAAHAALQFENTWLARYPRPDSVIHDQGKEFIGFHFQQMLQRNGVRSHPTTVKNPQANAICERMHHTVGNTLHMLSTLNPPAGVDTANRLVEMALANCMFATRATVHGTLQTTPGSIAFHRDMILNLPLIADLQVLQERRQQLIDERLIRANRSRFSHDYHVGEEVLKLVYKPDKLQPKAEGPYLVHQVHTNGTVTLQKNAHTIECISIHRIKPYRQ
jgi:transposase InsO family protein